MAGMSGMVGMAGGTGNAVADAAAMGLAMTVIAPLPALQFSGRVTKIVRILARHPILVLTVFVFDHAALMAAMAGGWSPAWLTGLLRVSLVVTAVGFWLPVVDRVNGLGEAARRRRLDVLLDAA